MKPETKAAEATENLLQATDMDKWKDLTSRLVVFFLANDYNTPKEEAKEVESYHYYMTNFFNELKAIQTERKGKRL